MMQCVLYVDYNSLVLNGANGVDDASSTSEDTFADQTARLSLAEGL